MKQIREVEKTIAGAVEKVRRLTRCRGNQQKRRNDRIPEARIFIDPGTWCPLHTLLTQWMKNQEQPAWLMAWVESVANGL
jgi:hypothetical protein